MDGRDMQRRVGGGRRRAQERQSIEALRRNQAAPQGGSAADCLKAGRDPEKKLEELRRSLGSPHKAPEAFMR
ncbi:hypothetical protein [Falsiroseomonas sp.]|uniref:hypothetical protein n=1 Tax=Falsiroseomonas sp. TaxID=2870721 RepID=UPI0035625D14